MLSFSKMDETRFEELIFELLAELQFVNVDWRKGTNLNASPADRGRDIQAQLQRCDIDGTVHLETWFADCKHYERGVPPEKLQSLLAWAEAERPRMALIVVSGFLSNPAKDYLSKYVESRRPPFEIKVWERPQLERILAGKTRLLNKFGLAGPFPFLELMHPVHLRFIREAPINTMSYFFSVIDKLPAALRDEMMTDAYHQIIQPRLRRPKHDKETIAELMIDEVSYRAFRKKCGQISSSGLHQMDLVFLVVSRCIGRLFRLGDATSADEFLSNHRHLLLSLEADIVAGRKDPVGAAGLREISEAAISDLPARMKRSYELYNMFCDQVVEPLFLEPFDFRTPVDLEDFGWAEDDDG